MRVWPDLRRPTPASFVAVHIAAGLFAILFVADPLMTRFAARHATMADQVDELRRLTLAETRMRAMAAKVAGPADPFLSASDERTGSADLQAMLQGAVKASDATFVGVRGLPPLQIRGLRTVAARVDVDGALPAVAATLHAIEDQVPLLWVTGATVRPMGDPQAPPGTVHAEFQVAAALKPLSGARRGTAEADGRGAGEAQP